MLEAKRCRGPGMGRGRGTKSRSWARPAGSAVRAAAAGGGGGAVWLVPCRPERADRWREHRAVVVLNDGSFGSVPVEVMARKEALRDGCQLEPVRFVVEELEPWLDSSGRA